MKEKNKNKVAIISDYGKENVKKERKKFFEPEIQMYDNLTDITFFTQMVNGGVSGGTFF